MARNRAPTVAQISTAMDALRRAQPHGLPGSHLLHLELEIAHAKTLMNVVTGRGLAGLLFAVGEAEAAGKTEVTLIESERNAILETIREAA